MNQLTHLRLLIVALLCLVFNPSWGQQIWKTQQNNIYYSAGTVNIGLSPPPLTIPQVGQTSIFPNFSNLNVIDGIAISGSSRSSTGLSGQGIPQPPIGGTQSSNAASQLYFKILQYPPLSATNPKEYNATLGLYTNSNIPSYFSIATHSESPISFNINNKGKFLISKDGNILIGNHQNFTVDAKGPLHILKEGDPPSSGDAEGLIIGKSNSESFAWANYIQGYGSSLVLNPVAGMVRIGGFGNDSPSKLLVHGVLGADTIECSRRLRVPFAMFGVGIDVPTIEFRSGWKLSSYQGYSLELKSTLNTNDRGDENFIVSSDRVGIGTSTPQSKLDVNGTTTTKILTITGGGDIAEPFSTNDLDISPGSVVIIDEDNPGNLRLSTKEYDKKVVGVISGANGINPGISLSQEGKFSDGQLVALMGRVYVKANNSNGKIEPGDFLTTSSIPGEAMKVTEHEKAQGAVIGKAMTSLKDDSKMVLMIISLQ